MHSATESAFKAGDVLVEYDCALPKARLLRAEAAASAAEGRWRSARELRKLNSISTADYEEARANVGIAAAEAKAERIQVGRCSIKAPFSGMVGERMCARMSMWEKARSSSPFMR